MTTQFRSQLTVLTLTAAGAQSYKTDMERPEECDCCREVRIKRFILFNKAHLPHVSRVRNCQGLV